MRANFLTSNLIAHRGIHYKYLENTLEAFQETIKYGYIIELDVRLTKDKQVIVFHDNNLKRIFGINRDIFDLTLKEIKKYIYIPTLNEVLNLVQGKVAIIIDLKSINKIGVLEKEVSKILDNYKGNIAIQSFNPISLLWFRLNNKNYARGYLVHTLLPTNLLLRILLNNNLLKKIIKPDYIGINLSGLKLNYVKKLRSKYLLIGYTVSTKEEYITYKPLADNLIYNIKQETVPLRTVSQKE